MALALLTVHVLNGCASMDMQSSNGDADPESTDFQQVSVPIPLVESIQPERTHDLTDLRQISRPTANEWLLAPYEVVFSNMPAKRALELALAEQPVRFELQLESMPNISLKTSPTKTVLDAIHEICRRADWLCEFESGTLSVSDLETRDFAILAQPGRVSGELSINSLDAGEGSDLKDGESVVFEDVNPYTDEIEPLIDTLLEEDIKQGVPVQRRLLPRVNTVVVKARPSTIAKVADAIELYNDRTAKLVRVFLTVYEVATNTRKAIGSRLAGVQLGSKFASIFGWSARPLQPEGVFQFSVANPTSSLNGSELLLDWLNNEGDASVSLTDQLDVRNNRIASSSSTRTFQYVASITRELDNLGRERTEVKRSQLRTGWSITVHPTIGLDTVTVRLSLARRALVEERPFSFGDTTGTNFVTDDQNRSMSVTLKDGESRVITMLSSLDERRQRQKLAGLITRKGLDKNRRQSVILMRVELI